MIFQASRLRRLNGNSAVVYSDRYWMEKAYACAVAGGQEEEIPVGAVIVGHDGTLLGAQHNRTVRACDPTAHAEILAIRDACLQTQSHRLLGATLYVTLEPCAMCAGAIIQARIMRVVFAARDFRAGCCGSAYNLLNGQSSNHAPVIDEGILQDACAALLENFFLKKRS